ncbi:MAG: hypothetical protein JXB00_14960 [Bacteroidales bacterium]|nr:hypothetical protein [Bacteroidales bacterium]
MKSKAGLSQELIQCIGRIFVLKPGAPFFEKPNKTFDTPVVAFFIVIREIAGRQFPHSPVIMQAFTADTFFGTWI